MRLFSLFLVILLLSGNVAADCRDKECMPEETFVIPAASGDAKWYLYYDSVFNIGTNWFVIIESEATKFQGNILFDFGDNLTKSIDVNLGSGASIEKLKNGSISFPSSTFSEEEFNRILYINFTDDNGNPIDSFQLKIQINKPPADDMVYLWGGMTIFWIAVGTYTLFLSNKLRELKDKMEFTDGQKEKN